MNKQFLSTFQKIVSFGFLGFLLSCSPSETFLKPIVETTDVTSVTESTIETGGLISSDEGSEISARGVCWSTNPNPTLKDNMTKDAAGTGTFISKISGLNAGTTYYIRAYATNKGGTAFGLQITITTKSLTLTTTPAYFIMATSVMTGGTIASDGDSLAIISRGVCWNTFPNPTIEDSITKNGIGKGTFNSTIINLKPLTTYYVRSYVTNSNGTQYGNEINFTTQDGIADLMTAAASSIRANTATVSGSILGDGGAQILSRGVCWNTIPNPTIDNTYITSGGTGNEYSCYLSGLINNTQYYCRTFVTNAIGTFYGNEISFTTLNGIVNLTTNAATSITSTGFNTGGTVSNDGGSLVIEQGVCWSLLQNPTIADIKKASTTTNNTFNISISGLAPLTTYYVRSYATNSIGTSYGNQLTVTTTDIDLNKVVDIDGNEYATIKIGNQLWMASNLKTTKYRNGDIIANVKDYVAWQALSTGAWCDYDNSTSNGIVYGHLYNGYAVSDSRNIAPTGWHIPTDAEWTELETFLGGSSVAGAKMKETGFNHWNSPNTGATNESGFTAIPGGFSNSRGWNINVYAYWWTSTETSSTQAWHRYIHNDETIVGRSTLSKNLGFSIRCIKD